MTKKITRYSTNIPELAEQIHRNSLVGVKASKKKRRVSTVLSNARDGEDSFYYDSDRKKFRVTGADSSD